MRFLIGSTRFTVLTALALLSLAPARAAAQQPAGRIVGQVVDVQTGRPLPGAIVSVDGTRSQALAGLEGRFVILGVPAGTHTLRLANIGYADKAITEVIVGAGATVRLDVTMDPSALELEGVVVSAARERGSVAAALNEQRTALGVVSAITAEEMSRTPDGDAAAAARRVAGVTVQDGKFVEVRGLGERYTTTALNGARVPSPEPERKMVPMDMFPSGMLQSITTSKTFTPDLPGDFSGAQVDIKTRSFPSRQLSFSASTSINEAVAGQTIYQAPGSGREWLALAAADRGVPPSLARYGSFLETTPSQEEVNRLVGSFRNAWSARSTTGRPAGSFSASVGGTDPVRGHDVSYSLFGTYQYSQEIKDDHVRAQASAQSGAEAEVADRFVGETGTSSVLWGGMGNLSTAWGAHSRFQLGAVYNRTADDEARLEEGFSENLGAQFRIQRLRYVERAMHSLQLGGEHQLNPAQRLGWTVTRSGVSRREPDRSEIVYLLEPGQPARWFNVSNEGAVRTFGDLEESALEGALNYGFSFGEGRRHQLRAGGLVRRTDRSADNRAYSVAGLLGSEQRALSPEEIFDGRFNSNGESIFRITPLSQGGSYTAEDRLVAGYAMLEWGPVDRLRFVAGARVERSEVDLEAQSTLGDPVGIAPEYTDVLPSASLQWRVGESHALRLSASQTLSRPEYRELANVQYREVLGGDNVIGNPDLRRARIKNLDLRYEWYPSPTEAVTVALFAKDFEDPIERVYLATSGTRVTTFQNAEGARNYGLELELRKGLGSFSPALSPLSLFSNVTLMDSEIRLGKGVASLTSDRRPMVGQSRYVVNAGLSWEREGSEGGRSSATLLYNVAGKRIASAAEAPLPDVYEMSRHVLDLSLRFPLTGGLSGKADLKNLLDAPFELLQGSVVRESYRSGRAFSFGVSWQPGW
jgi:outer membrane receptor protein involved in Fe transport